MKHTIEIEGLPDGYEVNKIQVTEKQPWENGTIAALIHVKKKQPRRIVLEETGEDCKLSCGKLMDQILCCHDDILIRLSKPKKYWREIKESDQSLTNEEPKLSLTVDECREIFHCKTANTMNKIREFLKDK